MVKSQQLTYGEVLFVALGLFVAAAVGLLWTTAKVAALLTGHAKEKITIVNALRVLRHPGHPGPFSAPLYWGITALLALVVVTLLLALRRLFRHWLAAAKKPVNEEGLASRSEITHAAGAKQLLRRGSLLRPSLEKPKPEDLGFQLGRSRGVKCYSSVEDSTVVLGPPRSGKGMNVIIPMILDAPGSVITTSTRPDNLTATLEARAAKGPIGIFDPEGLAHGIAGTLRWSPARGCEDPLTATTRANVLCADASGGVTDSSFWQEATQRVVRDLLHCTALYRATPQVLNHWATDARAARSAVAMLRKHPLAIPGWADELDAIVTGEERMRSSVWAMVANVFSALAVPAIAEQFSPEEGNELHPEEFLRANGTLFLLGTANGAVTTARFVAALIEDVVKVSRTDASSRRGARLDPPLSLILDEAANFPLPSLTGLMSEGGGTGITTTVVLQSLAQARDRWGNDQADAIWETATMKIILGGGASAKDLDDLARLIGDRDVKEVSYSYENSGRRASRTENIRQRAVIDVARLRSIPMGHALMLLRTAPPAMLTLRPWTKRKDGKELQASRAHLEEDLRGAAELRIAGARP